MYGPARTPRVRQDHPEVLGKGGQVREVGGRVAMEHIYTKIGVTSRAAATLFATQHGLMGSYTTSN